MARYFGLSANSVDCIAGGTSKLSRSDQTRFVWSSPGGTVKNVVGSGSAGHVAPPGGWTSVEWIVGL